MAGVAIDIPSATVLSDRLVGETQPRNRLEEEDNQFYKMSQELPSGRTNNHCKGRLSSWAGIKPTAL